MKLIPFSVMAAFFIWTVGCASAKTSAKAEMAFKTYDAFNTAFLDSTRYI